MREILGEAPIETGCDLHVTYTKYFTRKHQLVTKRVPPIFRRPHPLEYCVIADVTISSLNVTSGFSVCFRFGRHVNYFVSEGLCTLVMLAGFELRQIKPMTYFLFYKCTCIVT